MYIYIYAIYIYAIYICNYENNVPSRLSPQSTYTLIHLYTYPYIYIHTKFKVVYKLILVQYNMVYC